MKKLFYVLCLLTATVFVSCSSDDDTVLSESTNKSLPCLLGEIVENCDSENGVVFVSYDNVSGAKIIPMTRGASNDGWTYGGRAKGQIEAVKLGYKLAKKLQGDRIILIRIVPLPDGKSWDVYYKYEDQK